MVATDVASMLNAPPVFGVFDFGQFSGSSNLDDYSLVKGPVDFFSGTTSLAASPFADGFAVSVTTDYVNYDELPISSSYTEDGGTTWTRFATMPKGATSAAEFGYRDDRGQHAGQHRVGPGPLPASPRPTTSSRTTPSIVASTWNPVELPGVTGYPADSIGGYMFGRNRQAVVADEVTPGVFYLYDGRRGAVPNDRRRRHLGTDRHDGEFSLGDRPTSAPRSVRCPAPRATLFFTDGAAGGHDFTGPQEHSGWPFLRSTDGGATWAAGHRRRQGAGLRLRGRRPRFAGRRDLPRRQRQRRVRHLAVDRRRDDVDQDRRLPVDRRLGRRRSPATATPSAPSTSGQRFVVRLRHAGRLTWPASRRFAEPAAGGAAHRHRPEVHQLGQRPFDLLGQDQPGHLAGDRPEGSEGGRELVGARPPGEAGTDPFDDQLDRLVDGLRRAARSTGRAADR